MQEKREQCEIQGGRWDDENELCIVKEDSGRSQAEIVGGSIILVGGIGMAVFLGSEMVSGGLSSGILTYILWAAAAAPILLGAYLLVSAEIDYYLSNMRS